MFRILRNLFARAPSPLIIKAREEKYISHFGAEPTVYHSTNWVFPHVDVYAFAPTAARPWSALVTGGMAEYQQPAGPVRIELILKVGTVTPTALNLLKMLAEFPARFDTFLAKYHTVPLGGLWSEASQISAFLLAPADVATSSGLAFELSGDAVEYLLAVPITQIEHAHAQDVGSEDLFRRLREANLLVHMDDCRQSVVEYPSDEYA